MPTVRHLFRPGQGQTIVRYTAAVSDGVIYPGDWVSLSIAAPTSQGVSGVMFGKTLGAADFLECTLSSTAVGMSSLCLGVCMGKSITAVSNWTNVLANVLADQDIAIIQCAGVHPNARQAASGVAGDYLITSATTGEADNVLTAAAGITGITKIIGNALFATATYLRVTAADEDGGPTWITCL